MKVWNELQWQTMGLVVSTRGKGNALPDYNKKRKRMKPSFPWDVRRRCLVVVYRRFGKT
jgi:hypothetical protein